MKHTVFYAVALMAMLAASPVLAQDMQSMDMSGAQKGAFDDAMAKMQAGMNKIKPTGDVDTDFVQNMIVHHQAAVDMATIEADQGKDLSLREMAKNMARTQQHEIDVMQGWLNQHPGATTPKPLTP